MTTHLVPRTVAELNWPRVRNLPLPSPQSLRVLGFFWAVLALLARAGSGLGPASASSVIGLAPRVWLILKMPS